MRSRFSLSWAMLLLVPLAGCALSHEAPPDAGPPPPGCMPPIVLPDLSTPEGQREWAAMLEEACGLGDEYAPREIISGSATRAAHGTLVQGCACTEPCWPPAPCTPDPTNGAERTCFLTRYDTGGGTCAIPCDSDPDCPGDMRCVIPDILWDTWGVVSYTTAICARVAPASPSADGGSPAADVGSPGTDGGA